MANNYYNFPQAFIAGTKVRSDQVNSEYSGLEAAFDLLPLTPADLSTGKAWFGTEAQGANTNQYVVTTENPQASLTNGQRLSFFATHTNDGAVTINADGSGFVSAVDNDGSVLSSGAIVDGSYYEFVYDNANTRWLRSLAATQSVPAGPENAVQLQSSPTGNFTGTTDFTFDGSELLLNASGVQILEARENEFILLSADPGDITAGDPIDLAFLMQSADNETYGFIGFDSDTTWTFKNDVWGAEILFSAVDGAGSEGVVMTMKADEGEVAFLSDFNTPVVIQGNTGGDGLVNGGLLIANGATQYFEETSAQVDLSGNGQLFVSDAMSPGRLTFRDSSGTEYDLTQSGVFTLDMQENLFAGTGAGGSLTVSAERNFLALINAGSRITTGDDNIGIGGAAGRAIVDGTNNIAIGNSTLGDNAASLSGSNNIAMGQQAMGATASLSTAASNIAIGVSTLADLETGDFNVALGNNALLDLTTGDSNVALGPSALVRATTGANNVAVGDNAGGAVGSADDNIAIGRNALFDTSPDLTGDQNIAIGTNAMFSTNQNTANRNVAIGNNALGGGNLSSGQFNTALGPQAGQTLSAGNENVLVGFAAGLNISSGSNNVMIGPNAAAAVNTGDNNIVIGDTAGPIANQSDQLFIDSTAANSDTPLIGGDFIAREAALGTLRFDADQVVGPGVDDYVLTYDDASGLISLEQATGGGGGASLPDEATDHQRAGNTQIPAGEDGGDAFFFTTVLVTEDTWETVGPTGSGADNIWTAMDDIPAGATHVILSVDCAFENAASGVLRGARAWAAQGDAATPVNDDSTVICEQRFESANANDRHIIRNGEVRVALDPATLTFQIRWNRDNASDSFSADLHYRGFGTDAASLGGSLPATVANHVRAGNTQLWDGTINVLNEYDIQANVTENAWESFGPTGSGADNIWTDLDQLPDNATHVKVRVAVSQLQDTNNVFVQFFLYVTDGDSSVVAGNADSLVVSHVHEADGGNRSFNESREHWFPLNANKVFRLRWSQIGGPTPSVDMFYRGFKTDAEAIASASAGGADTELQYNDNGAFAGAAEITYNNADGSLAIDNDNGTNLTLTRDNVTNPSLSFAGSASGEIDHLENGEDIEIYARNTGGTRSLLASFGSGAVSQASARLYHQGEIALETVAGGTTEFKGNQSGNVNWRIAPEFGTNTASENWLNDTTFRVVNDLTVQLPGPRWGEFDIWLYFSAGVDAKVRMNFGNSVTFKGTAQIHDGSGPRQLDVYSEGSGLWDSGDIVLTGEAAAGQGFWMRMTGSVFVFTAAAADIEILIAQQTSSAVQLRLQIGAWSRWNIHRGNA